MIIWNNVVDHVYCLQYLGQFERMSYCNTQLDRVGLLHSKNFSYHFSFDIPYLHVLQEKIHIGSKYPYMRTNDGCFNAVWNHYLILKEAIARKFRNIMILESDITFLKDLDVLEQYINTLPSDSDFVLFDYNPQFEHRDKMQHVSNLYLKYDRTIARYNLLTWAYMSNKMMNVMVSMFETEFGMADEIWNNDEKRLKTLNYYISDRHLAIQKQFDKRSSSQCSYIDLYKRLNVNTADYWGYTTSS